MQQNFSVPILQNGNKICFLLQSVKIHLVMHILSAPHKKVSHSDAYLCACLLWLKWLWQKKWNVIEEICAAAF